MPMVAASPASRPVRPKPKTATRAAVRQLVMPASTDQLHIIVLDQRIGEELVGRLLERGLRALAVASRDLDVEDLALADAGDAVNAERLQRPLDRLALRVEYAGFQGNSDAGLHGGSFRAECKLRYGMNRWRRKPQPAGARRFPHDSIREHVVLQV